MATENVFGARSEIVERAIQLSWQNFVPLTLKRHLDIRWMLGLAYDLEIICRTIQRWVSSLKILSKHSQGVEKTWRLRIFLGKSIRNLGADNGVVANPSSSIHWFLI